MIRAAVLLAALLTCGAAHAAAPCRTGGPFNQWLAELEREAVAQGISQSTIAEAAPYLTYDQRIVNIDRGQRVFTQTFLEFSDRMAAAYRIQRGQALIKKYEPIFTRIAQQYGVPAPVIVAFWGLESDFGANMGNYRSLPSLVSLAYDCRRADRFRAQLLDALRLIQRGDLRPDEMIGSWAGELGQTQMMPSEYYKYAVDYDGDGKRNLLRSVPDVLASTANYLVGLGWKRGEPWLTEVRVPAQPAVATGRSRYPIAAVEMGGLWRDARRRPAAAGRTICRPRCCCRWDGSARRFWSMRISRSICSGTIRWSIRPRPLISRPASPAPRRFTAAIRRRHCPLPTSKRCRPCWRMPATTSAPSTAFSV